MKNLHHNAALWTAVCFATAFTACGGSGGGSTPPPPVQKSTPTITLTPSASTITTAQALSVAVTVTGGSGKPVPTGSVSLTSGAYTSAATPLSAGAATVNVAAGSLPVGADTLTGSYI